jgi:hypothetical protein
MERCLGHNAGEINARRGPEPANRPGSGRGVEAEARVCDLEATGLRGIHPRNAFLSFVEKAPARMLLSVMVRTFHCARRMNCGGPRCGGVIRLEWANTVAILMPC